MNLRTTKDSLLRAAPLTRLGYLRGLGVCLPSLLPFPASAAIYPTYFSEGEETEIVVAPGLAKKSYAYQPPIDEEKLRKQLVYYVYRGKEEADKEPWFPGNLFDVQLEEDQLGEAQVILVEAQRLEDLTQYDAMLTGFGEDVEELRNAIRSWLGFRGEAKKEGFFKVLYRWL